MYSIFDIFKIGIGPSSSHTVGPMKAAKDFMESLSYTDYINKVEKINVELYGSLSFTGRGHNIEIGLILGLLKYKPDTITDENLKEATECIESNHLNVANNKKIIFDSKKNIILNTKKFNHSNKMKFTAYDSNNKPIAIKTYISIGGGFIIEEGKSEKKIKKHSFPHIFSSCENLLQICDKNQFKIYELVLENEKSILSKKEVYNKILEIWDAMNSCINKGLITKGILKGGLNLKRRAPEIYKKLKSKNKKDVLSVIDWINLYAMAVNEENASGGRVVTAPTNGAAGIIPAVLKYYLEFTNKPTENGLRRFFLTSGAIGILYKKNASISGADVGCQGEVGVACSMAAGGLVSALGGSNKKVENAAEIAMEHNLGLTCDPIKGLVQIPCIERNAMGAVKAINAARIAMVGKGEHKVSLDEVIKTMMQTGKDMQSIYKETSKGGLAVNVTEC